MAREHGGGGLWFGRVEVSSGTPRAGPPRARRRWRRACGGGLSSASAAASCTRVVGSGFKGNGRHFCRRKTVISNGPINFWASYIF
jgi:hypothetical protein